MRNPTSVLAGVIVTATATVAPLAAQALELDVRGGSMPGPLVLDTYPANFPFELMAIVPSTTPGPTPIGSFTLSIGLDLVGLMWVGLADLDLHLTVPAQLGSAPAFQDLPIYFQAVTFQFQPMLLDRISNPNLVRLGVADTFRDRFVTFANDRAFATVLPRTDRKWLLVGGARGQLLAQVATATTEIYDPWTDSFGFGPSLNAPRSLHTATLLDDGRWLVVGGVNMSNDPQATCEAYDPVSDTFTPVASMGTPRMGHTATKLPDGRVLVTGGLMAVTVTPTQLSAIRDATDTTEIYDPIADTWTPGPNLLKPRAAHVAILRPNGTVLLAGGISWDPNVIFGWVPAVRSSCDLYNPATNLMTAGPSMATARSLVDAVDLGGDKWLLAGGINGLSLIPYNPGNPTAAAEIYDAAANTWTPVGAMATARGNHRGWALGNGRFLLAGGANSSILAPNPLSSTEVFSTATNSFSPGPAMTSARAGAAAFLTPQGQMMLFGGASAGNSIVNTTEWYYY